MRGGLWSSFSVPGAGMLTRLEWYSEGAQVVSGVLSVARWLPHASPACCCWSAVSPVRSTGVVVSISIGHRTSHQSAVVSPVEPEPWTAMWKLILQVGGLIVFFVVIDAEGKSVLSDR